MHRYLIIIEKAAANYSAYSPDLPGCVATGPTVEDTRSRMQEAVAYHVEGLKARGLAVPVAQSIPDFVTVE